VVDEMRNVPVLRSVDHKSSVAVLDGKVKVEQVRPADGV
jgi:hypothetical protein